MRTLFLLVLLVPTIASAQSPTLINIPQMADSGFDGYINAVYAMFISIAALLAVVKIIVAGVKYMFSDVVTQKSDAKKDIRSALLGLVIVLAAVLILTVINPNLTSFDLDVQQTEVVPRPILDRLANAIQNPSTEVPLQRPCDGDCDAVAAQCGGEAIIAEDIVACITPVEELIPCPALILGRGTNCSDVECSDGLVPTGTTDGQLRCTDPANGFVDED